MSKPPKSEEEYSEAEAQRRFEQTLKGALKTPVPAKEKGRGSKPALKK